MKTSYIHSKLNSKFLLETLIVAGSALGALGVTGYFEPRYTCSIGASTATQASMYIGMIMISLGIGGIAVIKRSSAHRLEKIARIDLT